MEGQASGVPQLHNGRACDTRDGLVVLVPTGEGHFPVGEFLGAKRSVIEDGFVDGVVVLHEVAVDFHGLLEVELLSGRGAFRGKDVWNVWNVWVPAG